MKDRYPEIKEKQLARVNAVKPSFWLLHSLGWLGYVVIFSADNLLFHYAQVNRGEYHVTSALLISAAIAWSLTIPLRYLYRRCWNFTPLYLGILIVTSCIIVAALWTPIKNTAIWQMSEGYDIWGWFQGTAKEEEGYTLLALYFGVSNSFFMILAWSSLYFGINYHFRLVREKEQHLQAVRLSHNAQIKMLRYQINPHFLFNTLNAISTLVLRGSKDKANGMLTRLSTFLRFSLDNDPEQKIRLYEELKALMLYLEIEKTRFDDRLSVHFNVEARAESLLVPSLLLQPLVENSIKYAIARMVSGGRIEIVARCQNNLLHLEVADNGPNNEVLAETEGTSQCGEPLRKGVGLSNIRERLNVLYPHGHHFEVINQPSKGFRIIIEIPIEES
jgi:two-component system LytT family sensor kinase